MVVLYWENVEKPFRVHVYQKRKENSDKLTKIGFFLIEDEYMVSLKEFFFIFVALTRLHFNCIHL